MDPSPHTFAESGEATTYLTLRYVLQNHGTTHRLSLLAALSAVVLLFIGTCVQLCEAGGAEEGPLLRQMLVGLKQRVRTRAARVPCFLRAETAAEPQHPRVRQQTAGSVGRSPHSSAMPPRPIISRGRVVGGSRAHSWPMC